MTDPDAAIALPPILGEIRSAVDEALFGFLADERAAIAGEHAAFLPLFEEVERVVRSGGKRLRPMFCWLGYRAGGGTDDRAVGHVAAALELFHTFALVHDDVMDDSAERRGAPTIHVRMAGQRGSGQSADRFGISSAILAGDLAMVLADQLFLHAAFAPDRLAAAFRRYNRMRIEVAVGQFLDIEGSGRTVHEAEARRISALKSGSYTVEGPLQVGAILTGAPIEMLSALSRYGLPLGEAFQLQDDLAGVEAGPDLAQRRPTVVIAKARLLAGPEDRRFLDEVDGREELSAEEVVRLRAVLGRSGAIEATRSLARDLVTQAVGAIDGASLDAEVVDALRALAELIARPEALRPAR